MVDMSLNGLLMLEKIVRCTSKYMQTAVYREDAHRVQR